MTLPGTPPAPHPVPDYGPPGAEAPRVSTLELFFDLVFVFAITQLTTVLLNEPNALGLLRVSLMLGVIWWMYGGYCWLTNAVAPNSAKRRMALLGGMAGFLVLALAIPRAFTDSGRAFGLAYLAVVAIHAALFTRTPAESAVRAILRLAPFNFVSALLVLLAGVSGGRAQHILLALAVALEWFTPLMAGDSGFVVLPTHFVERHGSVVIIAIGESVVAVGSGALGAPVDAELAGIAVLGLLLNACLWWAYFGGDDRRAEEALSKATADRRPHLALVAFGYWHLLMLLGIIAVASGLRRAIGHAAADLSLAQAIALGGGVALFMLADVLFRRSLNIGRARWRLVTALLAVLTIPLGAEVAAVAQLTALVALLAAGMAAEQLSREHAEE